MRVRTVHASAVDASLRPARPSIARWFGVRCRTSLAAPPYSPRPRSPQAPNARADVDSRQVDLVGDGGVTATAVLTSDGDGWLDASELPPLESGRTYQLWGDAGEVLVSLGVLGSDPGVAHFDARGYEALAITAEQAPGVVISEQLPVAAGAVTA